MLYSEANIVHSGYICAEDLALARLTMTAWVAINACALVGRHTGMAELYATGAATGGLRGSSHRVTPRPRKESRGGYDCEFVTEPPDVFQTECPVCLQIPKEPCVISCPCGKEFCRDCIERIKKANKPCPLCNKTDFTFLRHHGSERYLKAQEVWCSHKKNGCEWMGKLGEFEKHLNENPSQENQVNGCQFVEIKCVHECGGRFLRRNLTTHQIKECPQRPYSCEYCHEYNSTFKDVTQVHYPHCHKYPVICRNKCRKAPFERQQLESHMKDKCPLTRVKCPLHYAGCGAKLPRKDMPEHMKDTVTHLARLANVTMSLLRENQELKQHIQRFEDKQKATEREIKTLKEETLRKNQELKQDIEHIKKQKAMEEEVKQPKGEAYQLRLSRFPIDFCVNYANKRNIYLPPFYTHSCGYLMCIRVCPNGIGNGKGTHVSIGAYVMQGSYDDRLKWPFRGEITIQIVNQAEDQSHYENTISYDDETPDVSAGRVTGKERSERGWGVAQFLAHTDLQYNAAEKTLYMKDDIIIVRVVSVEITQ